MNRIQLVIATCVFIVISGVAKAGPLSLQDAVGTALVSSPEIAASDEDAAAVRARIGEARAGGRLTLGLDMNYIHLNEATVLDIPAINVGPLATSLINPLVNILHPSATLAPAQLAGLQAYQQALAGQKITLPSFMLSKQDMRRFTLNLQKPVFTGGRVKYGVAQVRNAYSALEERAESKRQEVALATVKAYLGAVLATRVAQVGDEAYETVSRHVQQAESLFKQGLIPKYELMRAQTELANQDRRRLDAHNQADLALAFLMDMIGTPEAETPTLTTQLSGAGEMPEDFEKAAATAQAASTDMKALEARDRIYSAAIKSAVSERLPVIAVVASADLRDEDLSALTPESYFGVVAKMPILDGGVSHAKVAQQKALRNRNRTDIRRLHNGIRLEVRKNYLDLMSAKKALEASDKAVELATESRRLAERRFEVGEGTSMEVTDSILALSIAETNREQARYQYDIAFYGLKKSMGQILSEFGNPGGGGK